MEKSVDTQWLSARQVVLLAPASSELQGQVAQVLRLPRYVLMETDDVATAARFMAEQKVEVVVLEPEAGKTRSPATLARLREADRSAQILVIAPRATLGPTLMALEGRGGNEGGVDVLGAPFSAPELLRAVERARELRYLQRAEERGRRAEARVGAVMQSAPHAIVSLDGAGIIHDWNPAAAKIFGWLAAEAVGQCFWELAVAKSHRRLGDELPVERTAGAEITGLRRDGSAFPGVISLSAVAGFERPMYCAIIEDVTESRRLEVELRHAQKLEAVGRLASGLAHEINTPCQFMATNAEFLAGAFEDLDGLLAASERLRDEAQAAGNLASAVAAVDAAAEQADLAFLRANGPRAVAIIAEGVQRVSRIVAAMKDFAKPDMRDAAPLDINGALASTLTIIAHQTGGVADVRTEFGEIPMVLGHGSDLNQAFLQLLLNAADAIADRRQQSPEGGRGAITVRTRADGNAVVVEIGDTGTGIPEVIRHRIFEPFFTTREVGSGTGQGLPIARAIVVDKHRGTLTFESEMGTGTTFRVRLPALGAELA
jgi:PAS domain S-box-containing protein